MIHLRSIFIIILTYIVFSFSVTSQEEEKKPEKHTEALLNQVREQYERDQQTAKKKHIAGVIMGANWGTLNAKDDIRFQLVRVYVEKEDYDNALKKLDAIIAQSPDPKAIMRAFCTRASIFEIAMGKPRLALKEYRNAIAVKGNRYVGITAGAYLAMTEIYLELGDRKRAKLILEESYRSLSYTSVTPVPIAEELRETEQ